MSGWIDVRYMPVVYRATRLWGIATASPVETRLTGFASIVRAATVRAQGTRRPPTICLVGRRACLVLQCHGVAYWCLSPVSSLDQRIQIVVRQLQRPTRINRVLDRRRIARPVVVVFPLLEVHRRLRSVDHPQIDDPAEPVEALVIAARPLPQVHSGVVPRRPTKWIHSAPRSPGTYVTVKTT